MLTLGPNCCISFKRLFLKTNKFLFAFNVDTINVCADDDTLKDLIKQQLKQGCDQYFQSCPDSTDFETHKKMLTSRENE